MRTITIPEDVKDRVVPMFLDGSIINLAEICAQPPHFINVSEEQYLLACKHGFGSLVKQGKAKVEKVVDEAKPVPAIAPAIAPVIPAKPKVDMKPISEVSVEPVLKEEPQPEVKEMKGSRRRGRGTK